MKPRVMLLPILLGILACIVLMIYGGIKQNSVEKEPVNYQSSVVFEIDG